MLIFFFLSSSERGGGRKRKKKIRANGDIAFSQMRDRVFYRLLSQIRFVDGAEQCYVPPRRFRIGSNRDLS